MERVYKLWVGASGASEVKLLEGGPTQYSSMREAMYRLAPVLEEFKCAGELCITDGDQREHPGDAPIGMEEPLKFEEWRATLANGVNDGADPVVAFMEAPWAVPHGWLTRTYAAGLGMWFSETAQVWQCYTTDLFEGDVYKCESALYAHYVGTFLEYINGTEAPNA